MVPEDVSEWLDVGGDSTYILIVAVVRQDRRRRVSAAEQALFGIDTLIVAALEIPAVTRVGYSAPVKTVHQQTK